MYIYVCIYICMYVCVYIYIYILNSGGMLSLWFLRSILHYLASLSDSNVIYLIHMQKERREVTGRSAAWHGINLVLDLNQKVLKFLVFLSNSSLYLSVFVLESLLMYFLYYLIVQLVWIFHVYWRCGSSC